MTYRSFTVKHQMVVFVVNVLFMLHSIAYSVDSMIVLIREAVPEGHHYLPARPYPPERIPDEELVPMTPEPFNRVKDMPVSELVYDEELDEFVVPKGYVSEDEMIDDQSVVWHPENHTVACKFRGEEEPVIWPYWKPADLGDVPKKGSWVADYYRRLFGQWLAEYQFRIF